MWYILPWKLLKQRWMNWSLSLLRHVMNLFIKHQIQIPHLFLVQVLLNEILMIIMGAIKVIATYAS